MGRINLIQSQSHTGMITFWVRAASVHVRALAGSQQVNSIWSIYYHCDAPRHAGAVVMAPAVGLSWPFILQAGWGNTQLSFRNMREFLNEHLSRSWIGHVGTELRPPRSPDLSPLNFSLGFIRDNVYTPPMLLTLAELWDNLRCDIWSWYSNTTAHLGGISVLHRNFPHNSWCANWTLIGKTWSLLLHVPHYFNVVTALANEIIKF